MRKTRSDSKLLNLSEETKAAILAILDTPGVTQAEARLEIKKQFGVLSSVGSLSDFYKKEKAKQIIAHRLRSLFIAQQISEEASARPSLFDAAMIDRISQMAFELSIQQSGADPDVVKQFFHMVLKARQQEIDVRKVAVMEEKARQADKAKATTEDSKLSLEEKDRRMRQIFGAA